MPGHPIQNILARSLALLTLIGTLGFWSLILVIAALTPDYSHTSQFISEMGATAAPYAGAMNLFGILPFGLGIVALGICLMVRALHPLQTRVGGLLVIGMGIGFVLAAFNSCDEGCRFTDMSQAAITHNMAAFGAFFLAPPTVLWTVFVSRRTLNLAFAQVTLALAMIGALTAMMTLGVDHDLIGLAQRVFILALSVWLVTMASIGLKAARRNVLEADAVD